MPARYAQTFSALDIQQHARIVQARGKQLAHVGEVASMRQRGTALCVVAADRPGLLATISAALSQAGLAVLEAEIFTRHVSASQSEAVDMFWVFRRAPLQHLPISATDVRRVTHHLVELLSHSDPVLPARPSGFIARASETSTQVRFIQNSEGRFTTLELDANDRPGLFLAICRAVFATRIQITGSRFKAEQGRSRGRFELVELDDSPIGADRRQDVQVAILSAIDELSQPTAAFLAG
jgi:UTP:GlnB (protein PII) uridylyltransferase